MNVYERINTRLQAWLALMSSGEPILVCDHVEHGPVQMFLCPVHHDPGWLMCAGCASAHATSSVDSGCDVCGAPVAALPSYRQEVVAPIPVRTIAGKGFWLVAPPDADDPELMSIEVMGSWFRVCANLKCIETVNAAGGYIAAELRPA